MIEKGNKPQTGLDCVVAFNERLAYSHERHIEGW